VGGGERIKGGDGSDVFLAYHQYLRTKSLVALLDSHGDDATLPELSGETRGQKAIWKTEGEAAETKKVRRCDETMREKAREGDEVEKERRRWDSEISGCRDQESLSFSSFLSIVRENDDPSKNSFPPRDRLIEPLLSPSNAISYLMISRHPRDDDHDDDDDDGNDAGKNRFAANGKECSHRSFPLNSIATRSIDDDRMQLLISIFPTEL